MANCRCKRMGSENDLFFFARGAAAGLPPDERRVLEKVPKTRGIGIERLGEACAMAPGALLATLLELELKGLVRQLPGRRFQATACKL